MTYLKHKNCKDCNKQIIVRTSVNERCEDCRKIHQRMVHRNYLKIEENRTAHYARTKKWQSRNKKKINLYQNNLQKFKPEIIRARGIAGKKLNLDKSCNICNSTNQLQRHHWRYDKPLLINTLCRTCHNIQHTKHFGENYQ